jgi:hypothetical protein
MASSHGKDTVVTLNAVDIGANITKSEFGREADEHEITGYGKQSHVVRGGLKGGTFTMEGWYDTSAGTGARAVIRPLLGTVVPFTRRPEGTGVGRPQDAGNVHVKKYVETNPVNDIVTWSMEGTLSDDVTSTVQ